MASPEEGGKLRVALRVRPMLPQEIARNAKEMLTYPVKGQPQVMLVDEVAI